MSWYTVAQISNGTVVTTYGTTVLSRKLQHALALCWYRAWEAVRLSCCIKEAANSLKTKRSASSPANKIKKQRKVTFMFVLVRDYIIR